MDDKVKHLEKLIRETEAFKRIYEKRKVYLETRLISVIDNINEYDYLIDKYISELCDYVSKDADTARKYLEYVGIDHEGLYKKFEDGINING